MSSKKYNCKSELLFQKIVKMGLMQTCVMILASDVRACKHVIHFSWTSEHCVVLCFRMKANEVSASTGVRCSLDPHTCVVTRQHPKPSENSTLSPYIPFNHKWT